jgi:transmembrane sensor
MTPNESLQQQQERLEQEAAAWQVRLTSGETVAEDLAGFEAWRLQSPAHEQAYRHVASLWQQLDAPLRLERRRRLTLKKMQLHRRILYLDGGLASAACLLLIIAAIFYPDYLLNPMADYRTRIGQQSVVTLADGSTVYLNTDTALDVEIDGQKRRVRLLRGEAAFEVAHDSRRPFRVRAGNTVTEALGTRFVVRYDNPSGTITLLQGKVRAVRLDATEAEREGFVLHPGERADFGKQALQAPESADTLAADAWRRGRLIMNFVPLKRVVGEINRYRREEIKLLDEAAGALEINVAIDLGNIDAWLDALPSTLPVRIRRAGPFVMIGSRNG